MADSNNDAYDKQKTSKVSLPLLLLFLLSLGLNAYLFYNWYNDNYRDGRSLAEINAELQEVLKETKYSKDSLQTAYDDLSAQYQALYEESETLRMERTDAIEQLGQKKVRIRQLLTQVGGNPKALVQAKGEIESLKKELNDYRIKLDLAVEEKTKYEQVATTEKAKADDMAHEKEAISRQNDDLEDKISDATFRISNLQVSPLRTKRKKLERTNKSGKVEQIEISFTILESPLVEEGDKVMKLRLIGTNQEVLGSDNSTLKDSDELYSMVEDYTYDGSSEKFKFKFKQDAAYKAGSYLAELYEGDKLITRSAFNLD
jgi:chromosome segregation ATPase